MFTICRSLGEIRPDLNKQYAAAGRAARQRYVGQDSSSAAGAGGQERIPTAVYGPVSLIYSAQIFVSFYLLPTPGNTCDVETVEQMIFP